MDRQEIVSSNIVSIGYDESEQILEIEFKGNKIYRYYDISKEEYLLLMASESKGKYFNSCIKNNYRTEGI